MIRTILLYGIFFFSGMASLVAEITWNKMLVLVIGNTVMATSLLLVAFMGGLGLGSHRGSRYFSKPSTTLKPYAILECCVGVYLLFSPIFFSPLSNLFVGLAPSLESPAILYMLRFSVAFISLFLPAFIMGATFPAIIAGSALDDSSMRVARSGYLYSINTIGAATGCLLDGYILLPKLGAENSLKVAFLFYIIAAAGAIVLQKLTQKPANQQTSISEKEIEPAAADSQIGTPGVLRLIAPAVFITGFVALAYEVLLTRLVILFFGNQLIVFTLVLTTFLLGTGISAFLGSSIHRYTANISRLFGIVIIIAGIFIVIPPFIFIYISNLEVAWIIENQDIFIGAAMTIPVFFIGGLLPIAIRILQTSEQSNTTLNAGRLYAFNTFGGMIGAGVANYYLIPLFGTQEVLTIFSLLFIAIGLSVLWFFKKSIVRWSLAAVCIFTAFIFIASLPGKLEELYTFKLNQVTGNDIKPELKLHHEGRVATITIIDFPWLGFRDMFLNGVEEASTRFGHVQLFKLLGLLPVLAHESDDPKETLMIAFGAGIAAGAAVNSEQVSSLDVVDLNPDIEMINNLFKEVNGDVFHNPKFNFISEDGRNYLLRTTKKYSVIISDSTHPRAYDSWILYTKEFYEDVKDHLLPGGVFAQWIPLSDFSLELYKIMMNSFKSVFPHVTLWNIYGTDQAFLLGTPGPFQMDIKRLQKQIDRTPGSLLLKKYQMDKAINFAGFFVMDTKAIERFIGDEERINTDNLPYNQKYSLKKISPLRKQSFDQFQASILPYLRNSSDEDKAAIQKHQALAKNMYRNFFYADQAALEEAYEINPNDGNVAHYKNLARQKQRMVVKRLEMEEEKLRKKFNQLKKKIDKSPEKGKNYVDLAQIYIDMGLTKFSEPYLEKALIYSPESGKAHELMGLVQADKQEWIKAEKMFEFALFKDPENKKIQDNLTRIYAEQNKHKKAINLILNKMKKEKRSEADELSSYQDDMNIAGSYFSLNDYINAEKYLLSALEKYPNSTTALLYLSHIYRKTKKIDKAVKQLNLILEINPFSKQAQVILKDLQNQKSR